MQKTLKRLEMNNSSPDLNEAALNLAQHPAVWPNQTQDYVQIVLDHI